MRYIRVMQDHLADFFVASVMANAVTVMFFYAIWRLKKNDNDWSAIGLLLVSCFIVGLAGYAIRYPT